MNTHCLRTLLVLGLMFVSGQATAIPVLDQYIVLFSHGGTTLGAGLTITAHTTETAKLFVGGDYTIECGSSSLQLKAEN